MSGKNRKMLYVGGLAEEVNEATLRAAFLPFGDLTEVSLPLDYSTRTPEQKKKKKRKERKKERKEGS